MKNKYDAIVVINGPEFSLIKFNQFFFDNPKAKLLIADGGLNHLKSLKDKIVIDYLAGDFDSAQNIDDYNILKITKFNPEKDFTDFQLVLEECLLENLSKIAIFGATGGRLDHFLANYENCISYCNKGLNIDIITDEQIFIFRNDSFSLDLKLNKTISIFSGTQQIDNLTLSGFKYILKNYNLVRSFPIGVSNVVTKAKQGFDFKKGVLVVIF